MDGTDSWLDNGESWIRWARADRSSGFREVVWPTLESVLPSGPTLRTLDLGCGEGRSSRRLRERHLEVVGVDRVPALARATHDGPAGIPTVLADAASLPFADAAIDLVVSCMSLQDFENVEAVIGEVSRVLVPNGALCFAMIHPFTSASTDVRRRSLPFDISRPYVEERSVTYEVESASGNVKFVSRHRPLSTYFRGFESAGMSTAAIVEAGRGLVPWLLVGRVVKSG